ncbi:MAG: hypothetical protein R2827_08845 [Bdellovibrionales bacterium]
MNDPEMERLEKIAQQLERKRKGLPEKIEEYKKSKSDKRKIELEKRRSLTKL